MENDQPPGLDGIPVESYKESYVILEENLLQLYKIDSSWNKNQQKPKTKQ